MRYFLQTRSYTDSGGTLPACNVEELLLRRRGRCALSVAQAFERLAVSFEDVQLGFREWRSRALDGEPAAAHWNALLQAFHPRPHRHLVAFDLELSCALHQVDELPESVGSRIELGVCGAHVAPDDAERDPVIIV